MTLQEALRLTDELLLRLDGLGRNTGAFATSAAAVAASSLVRLAFASPPLVVMADDPWQVGRDHAERFTFGEAVTDIGPV